MVLFDREKYYKTIGTGMVQFGVKMNFLQIKQVLTFIYALKLISDINFLFSALSGLGAIFCKTQGRQCKNPEAQRTVPRDGGLF